MIKDKLTTVKELFSAVYAGENNLMDRTHTIQVRVKSHRPSGGIGFLSCTDGTSFVPCQIGRAHV